MVWNSTQSALYKAVARHNGEDFSEEKNCCENSAEIPEKSSQKNDKNCAENTDKNYAGNTDKNYCGNSAENCPKKGENIGSDKCKNCGKSGTENCAEKRGKYGAENCRKNFRGSREMPRANNANDPLAKLFSDSDFLLIAALIYILSKNGADQKIILALIFVLIS